MERNEIYTFGSEILRVLSVKEDKCLVIDCNGNSMPSWSPVKALSGHSLMSDEELLDLKQIHLIEENKIVSERKKIMYERYTIIAPILTFVGDENMRNQIINTVSVERGISKQTIRGYLKRYLIFQNIQVLLPKERETTKVLTQDQKNMRWALNKFFYTFQKNSLNTAYVMLLKEKYCDETGTLMEKYPTFNQFRYFYRTTRKLENYYISRNGLSNYQRNNRPCIGDSVSFYATAPGMGMVDSTICDIYLVNECGQVVGRPILTACVDAYSGICMGYSLCWEGGIYAVRDMILNVIEDKQKHCLKFGIHIDDKTWPVNRLPGRIISDQGCEYVGDDFGQITELGVTLENLPPYRPDLKGPIEKFFDVIQNLYKRNLKGKGVVEPDYQERGAHDYRKDACLTIQDFEKIVIRCIIFYNASNVIHNFPFSEDMLSKGVKPYSNEIWTYGLTLPGTNVIKVAKDKAVLCLLPRTVGTYTRFGLVVFRMHYKNESYKERYLAGGKAVVAYDPDNTNHVWVVEGGEFIRCDLVESRFKDKSVQDVQDVQAFSKRMKKNELHNNLQAQIMLANHIQSIVNTNSSQSDNNIKHIRETRKAETLKEHRSHIKEVGLYE